MDGADINPYRLGNHTLFGPGTNFAIDTTKPFTVKTQFITDNGK
jgi:cellulose 1,4-beta-cellobiosidase